jgi:uncharacterized membrane protein YhaH (DUF805 family)
MANAFLPSAITRKQYVVRLLILIAAVFASLLFNALAYGGRAADAAGTLFVVTVIFAIFYHLFGLALPRLRSAQISIWAILLIFIPLGILVLIGLCAFSPDKAANDVSASSV